MSERSTLYAYVWRLPLLIWQGLFFVGPLILMVAMSFWLVRNYRMQPDFIMDNWDRMLGRDYFWNAYWITLWRATWAAIIASLVAFPRLFRAGLSRV
jgi:spermidine/putrescine transport system permease protein